MSAMEGKPDGRRTCDVRLWPNSDLPAGAVAGLAASGIAATFYAANCTDDSALLVITWYPIATLIITAAGYLIGRKLLRW